MLTCAKENFYDPPASYSCFVRVVTGVCDFWRSVVIRVLYTHQHHITTSTTKIRNKANMNFIFFFYLVCNKLFMRPSFFSWEQLQKTNSPLLYMLRIFHEYLISFMSNNNGVPMFYSYTCGTWLWFRMCLENLICEKNMLNETSLMDEPYDDRT